MAACRSHAAITYPRPGEPRSGENTLTWILQVYGYGYRPVGMLGMAGCQGELSAPTPLASPGTLSFTLVKR